MPPDYGEDPLARCGQLAQAEQETFARLQFTPPSPERAQLEQQLRAIHQAREPWWLR
jgi:hypothetical protein